MSLPWSRDVVLTFALEIAVIAAAFLVAAVAMRRRARVEFSTRLFISSGLAGALTLVSVLAAYTIAPTLATPPVPVWAQFRTNPVPDTAESVAAGRALYQQTCIVCHGAQGLGDGPAALTLNPRPVNLKIHVPQHPDGFLEYWIAEGVPDTQMPAWKDQLTEEQRWQIVRYLRALAAGNP